MEPSTDRERVIARVVDARASQGNLPTSAVAEIAGSLPFVMSEAEAQFLVRYIGWRRDDPGRARGRSAP